jgi:ActR/RegA family two-component response regulator
MHHTEHHFTATEVVRDIVIGMSDGLTVPFALAAGLSGTVQSTNIVVIAGFAEIAAGSIAMGLGGYLAAKTDLEHYHAEEQREYRRRKRSLTWKPTKWPKFSTATVSAPRRLHRWWKPSSPIPSAGWIS